MTSNFKKMLQRSHFVVSRVQLSGACKLIRHCASDISYNSHPLLRLLQEPFSILALEPMCAKLQSIVNGLMTEHMAAQQIVSSDGVPPPQHSAAAFIS